MGMKDRYKYETVTINGLDYITGFRFLGAGNPDPSAHEYPGAFTKNLLDENGKLRWVIVRDNPQIIIEVRQALSPEEEAAREKQEKRAEISKLFSYDDELKLMNAAIMALIDGVPVPEEYKAYRKAVEEAGR